MDIKAICYTYRSVSCSKCDTCSYKTTLNKYIKSLLPKSTKCDDGWDNGFNDCIKRARKNIDEKLRTK